MIHFLIINKKVKDLKSLFKEIGLKCYPIDKNAYFKYPSYYISTQLNEVSIRETSGNGCLLGSDNVFTFPKDYLKWKRFMKINNIL